MSGQMNLRKEKDLNNITLSTSRSRDVKDTSMLSGEAQDSLYGKNVTKELVRSSNASGEKLGGLPKFGSGTQG